jgi:hypothetical protein
VQQTMSAGHTAQRGRRGLFERFGETHGETRGPAKAPEPPTCR